MQLEQKQLTRLNESTIQKMSSTYSLLLQNGYIAFIRDHQFPEHAFYDAQSGTSQEMKSQQHKVDDLRLKLRLIKPHVVDTVQYFKCNRMMETSRRRLHQLQVEFELLDDHIVRLEMQDASWRKINVIGLKAMEHLADRVFGLDCYLGQAHELFKFIRKHA